MSIRRRMSVLTASGGRCSCCAPELIRGSGKERSSERHRSHVRELASRRPSGRGQEPSASLVESGASARASLRRRQPPRILGSIADPWSRSSRTIPTGADPPPSLLPSKHETSVSSGGGLRVSAVRQARSAVVSMSRRVRPSGSRAATCLRDDLVAAPRSAPGGDARRSEEPGRGGERRLAPDDDRERTGTTVVLEDDGIDAIERATIDSTTAPTSVGMSPPTTRTILARGARPAATPASGPSKATGSWIDARHRAGTRRHGVRCGDHDGSRPASGGDAHRWRGEERPAVDRLGELVAPEAARSAAREDHGR